MQALILSTQTLKNMIKREESIVHHAALAVLILALRPSVIRMTSG